MLISDGQILLRMLLALFVGAIIGFERTKNKKAAGIRTHALVCISSASITIISAYGFGEFATRTRDPARLAVGIITGIGFLGAGIIWKGPVGDVRGLTTAANIWAAAGLGIGIGMWHFFLTFVTITLMQLALEISRILAYFGIIEYDHTHDKRQFIDEHHED